ncbi:four-carbon acid sugar kinase family protein [Pseudonocardia benzenivorans]
MIPSPAVTGPVDPDDLVRDYPRPWRIDPTDLAGRVATGRRVVVLDDDPTGTQSVADVPVLTRWEADDLAWAFAQDTPGFFLLTNSRSLAEADAVARGEEVATAVARAAAAAGSTTSSSAAAIPRCAATSRPRSTSSCGREPTRAARSTGSSWSRR